jgi:hypothetical protein
MTIWMAEIEDEHGQFGMSCSCPCADEESAKYWLYQHLKNLDYLSLIRFNFTSFDNFDEEMQQFEYRVQKEYDGWEYGGRYYITISQCSIYTKPE